MGSDYRTDFLTSKTTFLIGMGSCIALGGNYMEFNVSASPAEADAIALQSDWGMIGQDLVNAAKHVELEARPSA